MTQNRYSPLLLLTTFLCLVGCHPAPTESFRVGAIIPLSNDFASSGYYIRQGIDGAVRELEAQGKSIEVFYEDACVPTEAISAIGKLLRTDKVDALASNFCVIALPAIKSAIERNELVTMQTSVVPEELLQSNRYVFSSFPGAHVEAKQLAEHAYKELSGKRAAVLSLETPWGEDYTRSFVDFYTDIGGEIVGVETKAIGVNDFRAELTRIKSTNPDVILLVHFGSSLATLLKQARQLGLSQRMLGVQDAYDPEMLEAAGVNAEGLEFFMPIAPYTLPSSIADAKHPLTQHAYANTMVLAEAFFGCQLDKACFQEAIRKKLEPSIGNTAELRKVSIQGSTFVIE